MWRNLFAASLAFYALYVAVMGGPRLLYGPLAIVSFVLVIPTIFNLLALLIQSVYGRWVIEEPEGPMPHDEAEVWLLERGYTIEHQCGMHTIGKKSILVPGMMYFMEIKQPPEEVKNEIEDMAEIGDFDIDAALEDMGYKP